MPRIFVITGTSGAGKTTVAERLLAERPALRKVVTCTTRLPREGEVDGVHYHFLSPEAFAELRDAGKMFEWAEVYPGKFYGSRQSDVDALGAAGFDVLFVVDAKGARAIKRDHPEVVTIFVDAPREELSARIASRGVGPEDLAARLEAIDAERAYAEWCDHRVANPNGALDATVAQVAAIMDRR